jgi:hypothetical protein
MLFQRAARIKMVLKSLRLHNHLSNKAVPDIYMVFNLKVDR